jgi:hypothetical protein
MNMTELLKLHRKERIELMNSLASAVRAYQVACDRKLPACFIATLYAGLVEALFLEDKFLAKKNGEEDDEEYLKNIASADVAVVDFERFRRARAKKDKRS